MRESKGKNKKSINYCTIVLTYLSISFTKTHKHLQIYLALAITATE